MSDSVNRTRHFWLFNRGDAHAFVLVKVLTVLQESLRFMGNFWEKELNTTELNFFLSKIFSTENNTYIKIHDPIWQHGNWIEIMATKMHQRDTEHKKIFDRQFRLSKVSIFHTGSIRFLPTTTPTSSIS